MSLEGVLTVSGLSSGYGGGLAIKDVELAVSEGSCVVCVGANGAGKSTLLKTLAGLLPPSRGTIHFEDEDITGWNPWDRVRAGISLVPEGRRILPLTVRENLEAGTFARRGRTRSTSRGRDWIYSLFPVLKDRLEMSAPSMSGGEQQMLAIGRALIAEPRLLLLDEPSLGLAPVVIERLLKSVKQIRDEGTSILMVEQNVRAALRIADEVYVLREGRISGHYEKSEPEFEDFARRGFLDVI